MLLKLQSMNHHSGLELCCMQAASRKPEPAVGMLEGNQRFAEQQGPEVPTSQKNLMTTSGRRKTGQGPPWWGQAWRAEGGGPDRPAADRAAARRFCHRLTSVSRCSCCRSVDRSSAWADHMVWIHSPIRALRSKPVLCTGTMREHVSTFPSSFPGLSCHTAIPQPGLDTRACADCLLDAVHHMS